MGSAYQLGSRSKLEELPQRRVSLSHNNTCDRPSSTVVLFVVEMRQCRRTRGRLAKPLAIRCDCSIQNGSSLQNPQRKHPLLQAKPCVA